MKERASYLVIKIIFSCCWKNALWLKSTAHQLEVRGIVKDFTATGRRKE